MVWPESQILKTEQFSSTMEVQKSDFEISIQQKWVRKIFLHQIWIFDAHSGF